MRLSRINHLLLGLIILINGYIVIAPLLPAITFWWDNRDGTKQRQLAAQIHTLKSTTPRPASGSTPQPNRLIVPPMLLDQPIFEGPVSQTYAILNKGIWRWPTGSTPDKGGNTVFIGHRFTYTQPKGVFYYLNKVRIGDEIGVLWNSKTYAYKVNSVQEVPPTDTAIENPTSDARLTIFTCTPLWLPKDRLVVTAELETKS